MSPDPEPSRTTSFSRARISKRLFPVGRATTRWKLLVPMSMAATGVAGWGESDTTRSRYPPVREPHSRRQDHRHRAEREGDCRSKRPSTCSTGARRCRSSPATARRSPAASTTRSSARWRSASATCASSSDRRTAVLASIEEQGKLDRRPAGAAAGRRHQGPRSRTSTCPTSPSGGPRRRSPGRPASNRWPTGCWPTRRSTPGPRRRPTSTPTRASPTPPPPSTGPGTILIERFGEDADLIGAAAGAVLDRRPAARRRVRKGKEAGRRQVLRLLRLLRAVDAAAVAPGPGRCSGREGGGARRRRRRRAAATRRQVVPADGTARIADRFGIADQGRPADAWLTDDRAAGVADQAARPPRHRRPDPAAPARPRTDAVRVFATQPPGPAARRTGRHPDHAGPRPRVPDRASRSPWSTATGKVVGHRHDLSRTSRSSQWDEADRPARRAGRARIGST